MDETALRQSSARLVQTLGGPRRLAAAALVGVAVLAALRALAPAGPPTVAVWAAAHDLPGGRPLAAADVVAVSLPAAAVPGGALRAARPVTGRLLAAPVRRGEPLTDLRLLEPPLLAALGDDQLVAVPVRVADGPAAAALVRPGDVVDVIAATGEDTTARSAVVAEALRVLATPRADHGGEATAGLVVVAATRDQAAALARASTGARLSLVLENP
jgi:Flp pilus assembly protein CpaB